MKKIIPHFSIENCKDALEYYQEIFGGEIKNMQSGEGMEMFKGQEDKIIHAELHINDECIIYFNEFSDPQHQIGKNFSIVLDMDSEEELNRIYDEIEKDGTVKMPLQDTFWGAKHGVIVDKNGIQWDLNFTKV